MKVPSLTSTTAVKCQCDIVLETSAAIYWVEEFQGKDPSVENLLFHLTYS